MIINLEVFCKYVEYYKKSYLLVKSFIIFLEAPLQHIIQSLYRVLIFLGFFFFQDIQYSALRYVESHITIYASTQGP